MFTYEITTGTKTDDSLIAEIIEKANDKVYNTYTLCDLNAGEKEIVLTLIKMVDEVDTGFLFTDVLAKSAIIELAKKRFDIELDERGFFKEFKVKE